MGLEYAGGEGVLVNKPKTGWPYLEATLFVAFVIFIQQKFFPGSPAYRELPFSLLWVPILLIAGRYGAAPAFFTGLLATAYYFMAVSFDEFLLGDYIPTTNDKVMFFSFPFVALFMGQMYDRIQNKLIKLHHEHEELKNQFESLHLHYESLQIAHQELEKRVVGRQATLSSLYEMARGLENLDEKAVYKGVMELISRFLHATHVCLFMVREKGVLSLAISSGYSAEQVPELEQKARENPLIEKAFAGEFPVSFRQGFEEQAKQPPVERSLMAVPIRLLTTGETAGILSVDDMPFLAVNSGNLRVLGIIADWLAQNLEKSRAFKDLKARELDDQLTGVYSYSYFQIRLAEEMNRTQRHGPPITLLFMRLNKFDLMSPENQKDLLSIIGLVFQHSIRGVDIPCRYRDQATFVLILPLMEEAGARILLDKLFFNIESYAFKPFESDEVLSLNMGISTFRGLETDTKVYRVNEAQIKAFLEEAEKNLDSL